MPYLGEPAWSRLELCHAADRALDHFSLGKYIPVYQTASRSVGFACAFPGLVIRVQSLAEQDAQFFNAVFHGLHTRYQLLRDAGSIVHVLHQSQH